MKFAYADPPYIRQAKKHYSKEDVCKEVNHNILLGYLCDNFDGWALSCSSPSLKEILSLENCPDNVRIAAWVKPFCAYKPNVNPAYSWEPVLYYGSKKRDRNENTVDDFIIQNITLKKGLVGAKPVKFCYWIIELLGLDIDDELTDIFLGTGIMGKTFEAWKERKNENPQLKMFNSLR